ncbi:hypothetical protein AAMO2058_001468300 [Amorphochlora amoebiformis]|uniref:SH2 domain-containing protein n=1 Tax=Amorphochlora amoebiformis TaxID=1561963 RepID=A0A7S0H359_9EUKA
MSDTKGRNYSAGGYRGVRLSKVPKNLPGVDVKDAKEIPEPHARHFWLKNFEKQTEVSEQRFRDALEEQFPKADKQIIRIISSRFVALEKKSKKDPSSSDLRVDLDCFYRFVERFGYPWIEAVDNIKKTFFREQELANKTIEYVMVPWYHGFLSEKQLSEILLNQENAEKFLVREPRNRDCTRLTVEYTKVFKVKDGKKTIGRSKRNIQWHKKRKIWVWQGRNKKLLGHSNIDVALGEMTNDRKPIISAIFKDEKEYSTVYEIVPGLYKKGTMDLSHDEEIVRTFEAENGPMTPIAE